MANGSMIKANIFISMHRFIQVPDEAPEKEIQSYGIIEETQAVDERVIGLPLDSVYYYAGKHPCQQSLVDPVKP